MNAAQFVEALKLKNNNGDTILHLAAGSNSPELFLFLLRYSEITKYLNVRNKDDMIPLCVAARSGSVKCLEYLLTNSSVKHDERYDGATLLHWGVDGGKVFRQYSVFLMQALGSSACVSLLLKHVPLSHINEKDSKGWIPLMYAANNG